MDTQTLHYALFQPSPLPNRYDALVCCNSQEQRGEKEKQLLSGPLDTLTLFLTDAQLLHSNSTLTLHLNHASSWFNKSTLFRFLHALNSPELLKSTPAILNEMSQLEQTRKFHLSLHSKEQIRLAGISGGFLDSVGMTQQVNAGTVTSEATKNELLRALDLRLRALNEELAVVFCRAISSNVSSEELSHLFSFVHHFCLPDLRDSICKNLETILNHRPDEQDSSNQSEREPIKRINTTGVSTAKLAQVERGSLTESADEVSSSGDEASEAVAERSRPVMRAPSPRRSASPMRRVQIGRSGSRRAQAIAIKSLSYFSSRDRSAFDQGPEDSGEEEGDRSTKKTEVNVTRISVKDAISLFECKQKDLGGDGNKKKTFGLVSTNKTVLRRWSSGMGESCTSQNSSADLVSEQNDYTSLAPERDEKVEEVLKANSGNQADNPAAQEGEMEVLTGVTTEETKSQHEELSDKALASAEWNRQKEAELNEMLLKMMGTRPGKYGLTGLKPNDKKGDHYSQYKEKRDAKLSGDNTVKRVVKQVQATVSKPTAISKKAGVAKEKKISPIPQQRQLRRNSAPLVAPKKEVSKATTPASRKASPRASPLPSTRSSWSAGPTITKSNSSQKIKSGNGLNSSTNSKSGKSGNGLNSSTNSKSGSALNSSTNSNTPISRRKPQVTPSTQPSLKTDKPIKTNKVSVTDSKLQVKGQEDKKPKTVAKSSRSTKLTNSSSLGAESCPSPKPSLYNKVTKNSSVVPLESKPSLKKSPVPAKVKASATVASPKGSVKSLRHSQDKEMPSPVVSVEAPEVPKVNSVPPEDGCETEVEVSPNDEPNVKEMENLALQAMDSVFPDSSHGTITSTEVQTEDDLGISSAAWVEEANQQEASVTSEIGEQTLETCPTMMEPALSTSPKIRHSLSQMLQAETHEPEIIEWGNAENPPALVFQKDSPKGFKRLLKFARKSNNNSNSSYRGDANSNGPDSPSVFSEGEDDVEEYRGVVGKNTGPVQTRGYGPQRGYLSESFDGGITNKRGIGSGKTNTISSDQSSGINLNSLDKLREGNTSSNKASRSFFSLSNFRSNKSNETKPR